ncbi:uncharacterized protein PHALS_08262 [Plasmopara halstedii]|uniref:Uncharacterized protein n=1 Tax=Plasmopara halstedii TaxID=4781 RepID=A0A0P1ABK6_PLAHL|nr:uncharacterized protein PHALS_08262 [Plasmopara halstedii]CEG38174.1 hypothetical protein PHALS_08262 [Plasmopara halstedii]|eukprot:XP_024574543.1 hypothetical protein PHALS_08262 [Plasmopara halstedii]
MQVCQNLSSTSLGVEKAILIPIRRVLQPQQIKLTRARHKSADLGRLAWLKRSSGSIRTDSGPRHTQTKMRVSAEFNGIPSLLGPLAFKVPMASDLDHRLFCGTSLFQS